MKKKGSSKTKKLITRLFNVRFWSDWDRIRAGKNFIVDTSKKLFIANPQRPSETFEEAIKRQNLSENDLNTRARSLYLLSIFMLIIALLFLGYGVYQLIWGNLLAGLLAIIFMVLAATFAFRYNFWHFQIKTRKLGCTVREWYQKSLLGKL